MCTSLNNNQSLIAVHASDHYMAINLVHVHGHEKISETFRGKICRLEQVE